jgi:hypothetical protein
MPTPFSLKWITMHLSFALTAVLSFSILIAAVIAIVRYRNIRKEYYPFIYLIWIGSLNEIISFFLLMNHHYNIVNGIIYGLCESLLLLWYFKNLGVFNGKRFLLYFLVFLFVGIWFLDSFLSKDFGTRFNSYFSIAYSFPIVLLSITAINRLLFQEKEIIKNPAFLICIAMVIYFTYKVVVEMFWLYGLKESPTFRLNVIAILMLINFFCNLIYALAILCMGKKQAFTLQF